MSWTEFKSKHFFSVNLGIVASIILWQVRKDLSYHWPIALWVMAGFMIPSLRTFERKAMLTIGKVNGTILLSVFYFLFFTPFSFIYRWKFRHPSFKKLDSCFIVKDSISDFDRPF
ncbi:MAG: hypothetical protein ACJ76H_01420 [Bacteriovoracaceae bacterium]